MSLLTIESIRNSSGRSEELVFLFGSIPGSSHTVGNQFDLDASVISPVGRRSVFVLAVTEVWKREADSVLLRTDGAVVFIQAGGNKGFTTIQ